MSELSDFFKNMDFATAEKRFLATYTGTFEPSQNSDPLADARKAVEALDELGPIPARMTIMKHDWLPPGTLLCSPDVYAALAKSGLEVSKAESRQLGVHLPPLNLKYTGP